MSKYRRIGILAGSFFRLTSETRSISNVIHHGTHVSFASRLVCRNPVACCRQSKRGEEDCSSSDWIPALSRCSSQAGALSSDRLTALLWACGHSCGSKSLRPAVARPLLVQLLSRQLFGLCAGASSCCACSAAASRPAAPSIERLFLQFGRSAQAQAR